MDIQDYQSFEGEALKERIRSLSRQELDEQLDWFGGLYAVLCQRLEAVYSPDRTDQFLALRPGGLDEIDKAIAQVGQENPKELALLQSFRELNRVLLPFMDVYEEQVLADLKYMSKEELETLFTNTSRNLAAAEEILKKHPLDNRRAQNASGTIRLTTLMKKAAQRELKERFGFESV
jgi:hypothetical protein